MPWEHWERYLDARSPNSRRVATASLRRCFSWRVIARCKTTWAAVRLLTQRACSAGLLMRGGSGGTRSPPSPLVSPLPVGGAVGLLVSPFLCDGASQRHGILVALCCCAVTTKCLKSTVPPPHWAVNPVCSLLSLHFWAFLPKAVF